MTSSSSGARWTHRVRAGSHELAEGPAPADATSVRQHRERIEPWLAALLQSEHLNLLVGSGLTTAVSLLAGAPCISMVPPNLTCARADKVRAAAERSAKVMGRGAANIEDAIRSAHALLDGLAVLLHDGQSDDFLKEAKSLHAAWQQALGGQLLDFLHAILATEGGIRAGLLSDVEKARIARRLLGSFLLTFASRTATRERLHVFTTNYDRLIEFGGDLLGLRILDRFVGELEPTFRTSRLGIDMHYNPPGIRGEPRYLEGVLRLTKLHGSVDWCHDRTLGEGGRIIRTALPFGASKDHPGAPSKPLDTLMIYPNAAKDVETLAYPYAELFRDFAAAVCQPNAVLVTYGYGFGDDHINRTIRDMLTIPSSHLAILSYDDAGGRIPRFCEDVARDAQITLLIGSHFGDLKTLVENYLPKPAIDQTTWRMVDILNRRNPRGPAGPHTERGHAEEPDTW